ncbi:hypothetical protein P3T30_006609 [Kitasatospora sp. MAP12-9]|nr:hypothetical protein [Kitasatospora sp. MAP12-44]
MSTPAHPEPVQYTLMSVYTDLYLEGSDGPALLTADPFAAAHFFLDTDRPSLREVMAHAVGPGGDLVPCRPGEIVERALRELPQGDPRRTMLHVAQADWLEDRLYDRQDEPFGVAASDPQWIRAGTAWGAAFAAAPGPEVLAALAERYPRGELGQRQLVMTALRTARAIRQAGGTVSETDRPWIAANWRHLNATWPARGEPAASAAATWYLERLTDLDPLTGRAPADLTQAQRTRWRQAALALQRDLLVLAPHLHRGRIEAFQRSEFATPPAPGGPAVVAAGAGQVGPLDAVISAALDLLPLQGAQREAVAAVAARAIRAPDLLPLPGQPAGDTAAALAWRRQVPSAQRAADDADDSVAQAYTYVARTRHGQGRPGAEEGSTVPARSWAQETTGRHAVLGRLLALAEAEHAATAHEPRLFELAAAAADEARTLAQAQGLPPMEVHYAVTAAHAACFDAARHLLDQALHEQRHAVRRAIAAHFPGRYRLEEQLTGNLDNQAIARAQQTHHVLGRELDQILAQERDPGARERPTAQQVAEAQSRTSSRRRPPAPGRRPAQGETRDGDGTQSATGGHEHRRPAPGRRPGPRPPGRPPPGAHRPPGRRAPPPTHRPRRSPGPARGRGPAPADSPLHHPHPRSAMTRPADPDTPPRDRLPRATCRTQDPELFFPAGNRGPALLQTKQAKAMWPHLPGALRMPPAGAGDQSGQRRAGRPQRGGTARHPPPRGHGPGPGQERRPRQAAAPAGPRTGPRSRGGVGGGPAALAADSAAAHRGPAAAGHPVPPDPCRRGSEQIA